MLIDLASRPARNSRVNDLPNPVGLMTNHHGHAMASELERHLNRVENHRPARDMMQHFRMAGPHPLAQAGRHHNHA